MVTKLETWNDGRRILEHWQVTEAYVRSWCRHGWLSYVEGVEGKMFHMKHVLTFEARHAEKLALAQRAVRHAQHLALEASRQLTLDL